MSRIRRLCDTSGDDLDTVPGCYLQGLNPAAAPADPILIDAAIAYAETVDDDDARLAWARYAHRAAQHLHGPDNQQSLAATRVFAEVLVCSGHHERAAEHWRALRDAHRRTGAAWDATNAHIELALAVHAAGRCGEAIREAHQALTRWTTHHTNDGHLGMLILAAYLPMLIACRRYSEAAGLTAWAGTHLPAPYRPHTVDFTVTSRLYCTTDPREHAEVCSARLDEQLVDATASGAPAPWRRHRRRRTVVRLRRAVTARRTP